MRVLITLVLSLTLAACAGLGKLTEKPQITLVNIETLESGNLEQRFGLTFRLLNPNSVALPIRGMSFDLDLQGRTFATGATPNAINVPAFGEDTFTVEVSTNLLQSAAVLFELLNDPPEKIDYALDARLRTGTALGRTLRLKKAASLSLADLGKFGARD